MDSYVLPIAALAAVWYIANKHANSRTAPPPPKAKDGIIPLAQLPRDPIATDTSRTEIAPRTDYPVSGALGFGVPSLAPHLVLPWQF